MPERHLLIDLGNSRLKWMLATGGELDPATAGQGDLVDLERACRSLSPGAVLLSSVADAGRASSVAGACREIWGVEPTRMRSQAEHNGVRNGYREPASLGVDRWMAILGAVRHHGKPVIVWDLGTATTLDAVDGSGQHLGGWILPGPGTMLGALRAGTSLPLLEELPEDLLCPGRSTAEAMAGGVIAAQLGALHRFRAAVTPILGRHARVIATGGGAARFGPLCEGSVVDPWLVFRGMLISHS